MAALATDPRVRRARARNKERILARRARQAAALEPGAQLAPVTPLEPGAPAASAESPAPKKKKKRRRR